MSRRNRSCAAFSLFAFQDIITAVTAIVILLVLILTLELITQRQEATAADPGASRAALVETMTSLESLVGTLSAAVPNDEIRPLDQPTLVEVERDARIVEDRAARAAVAAEFARKLEARARAVAEAARARMAEAGEQREQVADIEAEATRVEEEARQLAKDNQRQAAEAERREQITEQPTPGAELVFKSQAGFDRQAWIVEVSGEGLVVVMLGTNQRRELGGDFSPGSATAKWVLELDAARDHALVLVRPSGVGRENDVRDLLSGADIPFGIDFIGEEQVVRDGMGEASKGGPAGSGG